MRSKIFTKAIAVLLAAFMSAGFVPAVLAGGSSPSAAQYTVTASYGAVALPDGTPVTGPVAAGTVVVVTYDSASYPSNEFLYWKSSDGTKIPADTFRLLVDCDAWFFPVFSDLTGSFGDWILLHEGALCTDGDVYYRVDPVTGLIEYKKVYHNSGWHDFGDYEYVDEDHCACTCKVCGFTETEEHCWDDETVVVEPTHGSEGISRKTCRLCGVNVDTVIPRTDEHVYDGTWTIVEPSVNGQYGVRSRKCLYCDHTEEYWYLDFDWKSLFTDRSIRYKDSYGGKVTNNEQYYSYSLDDGRIVYLWSTQYVYAMSTGNDGGQTWTFMFIDDLDPSVLKPVYLTKTSGASVSPYLWAEYGYAYDFGDWLDVLRYPDIVLPTFDAGEGFYFGNSMSARASMLHAWSDDWVEEYNAMMIPADEDPESFLTETGEFGKWQIDDDHFSYATTSVITGYDANSNAVTEEVGGFSDCVSLKKWVSGEGDAKKYLRMIVDRNSGITVSETNETTLYTTRMYYEHVKDVLTAQEYDAIPQEYRSAFVCDDEIESLLKSFFREQGRNAMGSFTLDVPQTLRAARFLYGGIGVSVTSSDLSYNNDGKIVFVPTNADYPAEHAVTLNWTGSGDGRVFDRWERYDFENEVWVTVSTNTTHTMNLYSDPVDGVTVVRAVSHIDAATHHVTVTGGTVNQRTNSGDEIFGSEADVADGVYVYPVADYDIIPEGKDLERWIVYIDGVEAASPWVIYRYTSCVQVFGDVEFVPVYVNSTYYVDVSAENGTVFLAGNEYNGDSFEADSVLTFTTESFGEDYPYFYGWYFESWDSKDGLNDPELLETSTTYVHTVEGYLEGRIVAKWGATPEMPVDPYHDVFVWDGFATLGGVKVDAIRVPASCGVELYEDPTAGFEVEKWTLSTVDTLTNAIYEDECYAMSGEEMSGYFYVQDSYAEYVRIAANPAEPETLYGDANGDGTVDSMDLTVVRQYLADPTAGASAGADANGDGSVDSMDLTLIRQYLADPSTQLGPAVVN